MNPELRQTIVFHVSSEILAWERLLRLNSFMSQTMDGVNEEQLGPR